ncbi:hypothetical protein OE88DRAFT_1664713 [Heliocybe sulcata]|uniref:Calcineurin-like phosphoesterase domain-containing protein n=1 Tax=Heliocybe sulcata TaxID=5364 RepID=A0A5C3MTH0_9AGAM|nr:hypothetical protein OE88DRAFT_1664713 [Heliocybe sulcata]
MTELEDTIELTVPVNADYLALLGDTASTSDPRLFPWLENLLLQFKIIFYVVGNHEPYGTTVDTCLATLQAFARKPRSSDSKFILLNRASYDIPDTNTTILGCTLWSDLCPSQTSCGPESEELLRPSIRDFASLSSLTPTSYQALHLADLAWLNSIIPALASSSPSREIVVFTHHAPAVRAVGLRAYTLVLRLCPSRDTGVFQPAEAQGRRIRYRQGRRDLTKTVTRTVLSVFLSIASESDACISAFGLCAWAILSQCHSSRCRYFSSIYASW